MRILPDSIRTRTILVLLIGLTVSHLGSTLIYSSDRGQALTAANEHMFADKMATLARLMDMSPPASRQQVAEAISSPSLQISWGANDSVPPIHVEHEAFGLLQDSLRPHFGELGLSRLHVVVSDAPRSGVASILGAAHLLHSFTIDRQLKVSVSLQDASWVNFSLTIPGLVSRWSLNALLSTLVMVGATVVISAWATGWITAPLAAFAAAAERLGMDVSAPPLAEDGSREVRAAARAFNQMQERIRHFLDDRLQMLAAISHDLRTPITRLRLRTEQLPIDPVYQDKMLSDLDEMEQMVAANINFARDESSAEPSRPIDLAALLEAICDEAADIGKDAEFDWNSRLLYRGRALAIKRLFSNLVENALRYGERARVRASRGDDMIEVVVEDDGPGIPNDELDSVFKPFYRLDRSRNLRTGGVGLGLANARTIARAHGGDVTLENRKEGGLRAIVRLPCNRDTVTGGEG